VVDQELIAPAEYQLASPGHRIGAQFVDIGLYIVTLGIGWLIWNLIMWGQGQTPAKNLLKIRVVDEKKFKPANWGHMCVRQALIPGAISLVFYVPYLMILVSGAAVGFGLFGAISLGVCLIAVLVVYIIDFVWLFGPKRKRLIDYWAKTIVINEANGAPQYGVLEASNS
jgi:uncharacterized RDD family membrane protein YckC